CRAGTSGATARSAWAWTAGTTCSPWRRSVSADGGRSGSTRPRRRWRWAEVLVTARRSRSRTCSSCGCSGRQATAA
ncbi:MAG: hypothetical protein AVDCRST_MAG61-210, partial [uncultured Friedmanniella sp.]